MCYHRNLAFVEYSFEKLEQLRRYHGGFTARYLTNIAIVLKLVEPIILYDLLHIENTTLTPRVTSVIKTFNWYANLLKKNP